MAGVITAIEMQQKRKDRVNVYLDNAYAFSLNTIVAERAGLSIGSVVNDQDIQRLIGDDSYQKAFDSALNFLSYRPRSEKEVRLNLSKKRIDPDMIDKVISRLCDLKLLDDRAFAQYWQENRRRCNPRGPRAIKAELRSRGVETEVIDEAIENNLDQESDAYAAAQRKMRSLRGLDYRVFRQRLGSYLLRRGFAYDAVAAVSKRIWQEIGEEQPEEDQYD